MASAAPSIPPLQSGDHLSREEFHRRYLECPNLRAELVEGVVCVSSPVSDDHAGPHGSAVGWLFTYEVRTPGVVMRDNATIFMPGENEVQPDVCLFRAPPQGSIRFVKRREGRRTLTYLEGVPGLVFEVAASSAAYDMRSKRRLYERAGVLEYIAWLIHERRIIWFRLEDGHFVEVAPDAHGVIESAVFPGLRLDVAAMLAGDKPAFIAELERGLRERDASDS